MKADVAILGGGPAGATAALCLARAGLKVALVEASRYDAPRIGESLPPAVAAPLRALGLWDGFQALQPLPAYGVRSAWGGAEPTERSLLFDPHGPGWHVDRCAFDRFLAEAAEAGGATVLRGRRFRAAAPGWRLELTSGEAIDAGFVIDATGRAALFARRLGGTRRPYDNRVAVVARLPADLREAGFILLESIAAGWWYTAPAPALHLVAAFITDADLIGNPAAAWATALAEAPETHGRIGALPRDPAPTVVLADTAELDRAWGPGWIAIGDAAASFDPLSGDGVLRAMQDGIGAARAILGGEAALRAYLEGRKASHQTHRLRQRAFSLREQRWPDSVFWKRSQAETLPA